MLKVIPSDDSYIRLYKRRDHWKSTENIFPVLRYTNILKQLEVFKNVTCQLPKI